MNTRMDKYKDNESVPSRSSKNKELYRQIYNAYDEFENLVVPSNSREISASELAKEITSRDEYKKKKELDSISSVNNTAIRKEMIEEKEKHENQIYDIKELMKNAVNNNKKEEEKEETREDYLKKLKIDGNKTNLEQVKEMYEDISNNDDSMETESLFKTANLSLDILSDLKGDNEDTMIVSPIKDEENPLKDEDTFYSSTYKFSKRDFENREYQEDKDNDDEEISDSSNSKFFFKIMLLIFGIMLVLVIIVFLFNYFNRV